MASDGKIGRLVELASVLAFTPDTREAHKAAQWGIKTQDRWPTQAQQIQ
jgi:hypothetical protein